MLFAEVDRFNFIPKKKKNIEITMNKRNNNNFENGVNSPCS